MDIVKLLLAFETLAISAIAWRRNADLFSPVKLYIVYSVFFFSAIYFNDVRWETLLCYASLIQSVAICLLFEKKHRGRIVVSTDSHLKCPGLMIWLLSIPAIATMTFFIYDAGGVQQHLLSLSRRVETWKGQGHLVVFLNTLPTLNLIYFAVVIARKRKKWGDSVGFVLHFIVFFMIGMLTASRSYIAVSLLGMCVLWAYLVRPPKLMYVAILATVLIVFVAVMGAVRNNNYGGEMAEGFFDNKSGGYKLENAQMGYGVTPLEIVFSSPEKIRLGGRSYLTIFTNFIPRALWPGKPDTAGIIFTKMYTDDQSGLSYMATGAITEGILNFGCVFGSIFGVLLNLLIFIGGCVFYNYIIYKPVRVQGSTRLCLLVAYFYVILTCARFSYGEFTDLFQSLMFFSLLPLALIQLLWRFRISGRIRAVVHGDHHKKLPAANCYSS